MNIYTEQPQEAVTTRQLNGWLTEIHLAPRELTAEERAAHDIPDTRTDETGEQHPQEAWTATDTFYRHDKPLTQDDYGPLVSAIIRSRYSADEVEAITQNYLAQTATTDSQATATATSPAAEEFSQLQQWRQEAKRVAREIIESIKNYQLC